MSEDKKLMTRKKRKKWPWVLLILLIIFVLLILVLPGRRQSTGFNLRQATVEKGSLTLTVIGTGHLGYQESSSVEIVSGLLVNRVYREKGDRVAKGEPMASFDPLSIQLSIDAILQEIEALDLALGRLSTADRTEVIRAGQEGRVKAIYIEKGDLAAEVYERQGAVILLSLDGLMAVTFESPLELLPGEKIRVLLPQGGSRDGRIERREGTAYTVTLTDNGPEPGELVKLESPDGQDLGEGALHIHRPLAVIAPEGKVKDLHVTLNQKVAVGKALFTLEDLPVGSDYDKLLADREDLKEKLDELLLLQKTGILPAPFDLFVLDTALIEGEKAVDPINADPAFIAFTVAPSDLLALTIEVDELDVLSVKEGQEADLRFDAIDGQTFEGVIDRVANQAIEAGGIAKYPARVLIASDQRMRTGMSVTAVITVDEKKDILLLPVAALQESGGRVFVYTEQDEKTLELSGEVEVITGLSDGEKVEIVQGPEEGKTVFYKVTANDSMFPFSPPAGHRSRGDEAPGEGISR